MKQMFLTPVFVETINEKLEDGKLYISERYQTSIHLCACGCGEQTVLPFSHPEKHWKYTRTQDDKVTFHPSIGNFQMPCKSHYWIRDNQVIWC